MKTINADHSEDNRLIGDAEAERVIDKVADLLSSEEQLTVSVHSLWIGGQRWARNRAFESSNIQKVDVRIQVYGGSLPGRLVSVVFNQIDDKSLHDVCKHIREEMDHKYRPDFYPGLDMRIDNPHTWESKGIPVWNEKTYSRTATENSQLVASITERSESNGIMCFGSIDTCASHIMGYRRDAWGRVEREKGHATMAECSTTIRHPKGVGSGWAGASSFDITRLDLLKLGEIAFDKCMRSIAPVRIEPGRYQTILEPQATATFAREFVDLCQSRTVAENQYGGPLFYEYDRQIDRGRSKLGLRVTDSRLNISQDPESPIIGSHPYPGVGKIDFLKDGVLTALARTHTEYSLPQLSGTDQIPRRWSFEMKGTETMSVDEMISTTKRGLLLTRVSGMEMLDMQSALYTGVTRDGLWLIENGRITKAVRNFRWTESPMFVFNNVESIGESVPVMTSWNQHFPFIHGELQLVIPSVVVPTIKINDFSFTSTVDAV